MEKPNAGEPSHAERVLPATRSVSERSRSPFFAHRWPDSDEAIEDGQIDADRLQDVGVRFALSPGIGETVVLGTETTSRFHWEARASADHTRAPCCPRRPVREPSGWRGSASPPGGGWRGLRPLVCAPDQPRAPAAQTAHASWRRPMPRHAGRGVLREPAATAEDACARAQCEPGDPA
jgi:hypothetical protein